MALLPIPATSSVPAICASLSTTGRGAHAFWSVSSPGAAVFSVLPYGDQGLLISRQFYDMLGGYKRIPLMEDVDIVRRIGRRRLVALGATALTSAEKYQRDGYIVRPLANLLLLGLYRVGVSPRYIFSMYR